MCFEMIFRYEVLQCGDVEKLIRKRKEPTESPDKLENE